MVSLTTTYGSNVFYRKRHCCPKQDPHSLFLPFKLPAGLFLAGRGAEPGAYTGEALKFIFWPSTYRLSILRRQTFQ